MANQLLFGLNIDPNLDLLDEAYQRAAFADTHGFDLITIQDHPYQRRFFDTWTLMTYLAARTQRVHIGTNVANLPLRPPAVLAKMAASLDVLSGGRVELGLGAGGFWQAIEAWGVPQRTPKEAYTGFEDALHIIKGLWASPGRPFTYQGEIYSVKGAMFGPAPAHPIRVWVGGYGPKMLRLTGRMADGVLLSNTYTALKDLPNMNALIDEGAFEAGRSPDDIRRGFNVMGIIDLRGGGNRPAGLSEGALYGTPKQWVEELQRLHHEYRQDTFLVWPMGDDANRQLQVFTDEIMPAVKEAVAGK